MEAPVHQGLLLPRQDLGSRDQSLQWNNVLLETLPMTLANKHGEWSGLTDLNPTLGRAGNTGETVSRGPFTRPGPVAPDKTSGHRRVLEARALSGWSLEDARERAPPTGPPVQLQLALCCFPLETAPSEKATCTKQPVFSGTT